jgi:hypothetical protein
MCICQLLKNKPTVIWIVCQLGKTLLQDFNEIDRYLLDPSYVLSYLKDIEDIKKWGIEVENKTQLLKIILIFGNYYPIIIKRYMGTY